MKLRSQLLLINFISMLLLLIALVIGYQKMFLTLEQTKWLTAFTLVAGGVSVTAYWIMTIPITRSLKRLITMTEQMAEHRFIKSKQKVTGPTELRQLAHSFLVMSERLQASIAQIKQSEKAHRELVANVSHDLRTPLASIQSFVEALQDDVLQDPDILQQYLFTIRSETKRLSAMINDLFELSLLEAGQQPFQPVPAYLDQLLIDVLDSHQLLLREKNLHLNVEVDRHLPRLSIMPHKVARIISNLLQNAIRYSPPGGLIELDVRLLTEEQMVEIRLLDQGTGIPEHERSRIFERFYRTDQSRNRESGGAGLGLAIARSLVDLHGGRIGVRTRSDGKQGSEFWFRLPIDPPLKNNRKLQ
ncbi:two-component sensor histidine kinase [Marinithermofilum abyssi]|uniref:histidine kinase n=1 Tax=Marinithermofilum abyssi TaxID=1571185 RepID=A0A8J2VF82_9BACL|nr:ATP-binding protein [Marinithermofilum abyssi]GGE03231.1 two-component sensor histidine kinase [Marinithermofilum abyssi]